ncbi:MULTISPECIES: hypothetical protein [unclassified Caballeronia]|uniref:hypothetical protein n=1 Tax=unclassified Caballeronia TaxID=2646786 RepID=UPI0020295809|nr:MULTISPECIES: hypothetical protein [unclassified Caballeronia]
MSNVNNAGSAMCSVESQICGDMGFSEGEDYFNGMGDIFGGITSSATGILGQLVSTVSQNPMLLMMLL